MSSHAMFPVTRHDPRPMLGVAVVETLVDVIVSGTIQPGDLLPPEAVLIERFGVSRTVIRESIKLIEEKGLVKVARGRGTSVQPSRSWNILDPVVLRALIAHDESRGILDELSIVRAQLEAVMAEQTSLARTEQQLTELRQHLERMRASLRDEEAFRAADVAFHEHVMSCSGSTLAENIARILFERARESARYHGVDADDGFSRTLAEHEEVFAAIRDQEPERAREAMKRHIEDAWLRRRPPSPAHDSP